MAHHEQRSFCVCLLRVDHRLQKACYVGEHLSRRSRRAFLVIGVHAATPTALVKRVHCYAAGCEAPKEEVVAVAVVAEAVDEDEASFGLTDGLVELS